MLLVAVALTVGIGLVHSVLGERYILTRLFRQQLPKLFGSDWFTKQTLRFVWHLLTVAWFGFAALMFQLNAGTPSRADLLNTIGITFAITGLIALIASRAKHLSWIVFGAISVICLYFAT
ncbi:MAG: hypothetical protein ACR2QR_14295 [Woeseiaceae bacterium]